MRQVFTRWPTNFDSDRPNGTANSALPAWATAREPTNGAPPSYASHLALLASLTLAAISVAVAASEHANPIVLVATLAVAISVLVATLVTLRNIGALQRELAQANRWNATIFERTGISLWREDWTAARDAVLSLMNQGIDDIQAYFATRPDEARAIRKKVIIKDVNAFAVKRAGATRKEDLLGSLDKLLPDTDQTFIQWLIAFSRSDAFYQSETHISRPDGTVTDTLFTAGLPRTMRDFEDILVSDLDVTEFKAAQSRLATAEIELARASKAATVGALSASIAHEVNSPLAAIVSNAEAGLRWLLRAEPDLMEVEASLRGVISDAQRARDVVDRTRAFLFNAPVAMRPQNIVELVHGALLLIERELRSLGAAVHINARDGLPLVLVDAVSIQQVLTNLILNGAQAMYDRAGPRDLTISIAAVQEIVRVEIKDTGSGIQAEQLDAIFRPFYSTRDKGMGMGLSICQTSISAHGGRLWATSIAGTGSTFHFTLPIASTADISAATSSTIERS